MVGATHGTPEGFRADQASGSQQPPLAPPNLAEVMARQTELLNQLVKAQMGQFHHQSRDRDEPPSASCQDFPSSHCYLHHAQTRTRHSLRHNNFAALPANGGTITIPCSRLVMLSHGMNFGPLSERTTFQRDSLSESSMNF
jgi:hypothetical protein